MRERGIIHYPQKKVIGLGIDIMKRKIIICSAIIICLLHVLFLLKIVFNDENYDLVHQELLEKHGISNNTEEHLQNMFETVQIVGNDTYIKKSDNSLYKREENNRLLKDIYLFVVVDNDIYYMMTKEHSYRT